MFPPRIWQPSCSSAWLAASQAVYGLSGHQGYHVVIDVDNPVALSEQDAAVVQAVDAFLAEHGENPSGADSSKHHLPTSNLRGARVARFLRRLHQTGIPTIKEIATRL